MKRIVGYLKEYWAAEDKINFTLSALFTAAFIFINYQFTLEKKIQSLPEPLQYISWYVIFLTAFSVPYLLQWVRYKTGGFSPQFIVFLLAAPAIFSWKMAADINIRFSHNEWENIYWNQVFYWPFKLLIVSLVLFVIWKVFDKEHTFYGFATQNLAAGPYLTMLLMMIPLIALASTQPDFLKIYPKLKNVRFLNQENSAWHMLLYELSYGSDFLTIELFFRGFLVLGFAKWAGKDVILPMAVFYCTIHFGKPIGECISSFFGGLILGVITYRTGTITGGLMVHLGIAWMMELGGYLGNNYWL